MARRELANRFLEPNYKQFNGLKVGEIRDAFQFIATQMHEYAENMASENGLDLEKPNNAHMASIHHTQYLVSLQRAKDHYVNWLLSVMAEQEASPVVASEATQKIFVPERTIE